MPTTRSPHQVAPDRKALRVDDFCRSYGIGRSTAYNLINSGKLRSVMIAGRRVIPTEDAEKLLNPQD